MGKHVKSGASCSPGTYFDKSDAGKFDTDIPALADKPVVGTEYEIKCPKGHPEYFLNRYYKGTDGKPIGVQIKVPAKSLGAMAQFFAKAAPTKAQKISLPRTKGIDPKVLHIAKVLYCETGGQMHNESAPNAAEKFKAQYLVASVIANRVGRKSFGGPKTAFKACDSHKEFSCVNSTKNKHWVNVGTAKMNMEQTATWAECLKIASQLQNKTFKPLNNEIVYFHATSITKPTDWDKYFSTTFVVECDGHRFYSAYKKEPKKS